MAGKPHLMHLPEGALKPKHEQILTVQSVLKKQGMKVPIDKIMPANVKHTVHSFEHGGEKYYLKEQHSEEKGFADPHEVMNAIKRGIEKSGHDVPNPNIGVIEHSGKKYVLQREANVSMAEELTKKEHKEILDTIHNELRNTGIEPLDGSQVSEHGVPIDFDAFQKIMSKEEADAEKEEILKKAKPSVTLADLMKRNKGSND